MEIKATLLAGSIGKENGVKIATMELEYPRVILAELNTHRVFTRNGKSSRAVPFKRMVEDLRRNYHSPLQWLKNQPGMVATEVMSYDEAADCQEIWNEALEDAIFHASRLNDRNASKQYVNRLLEPWMMTKTLVTSTRWGNFFKLRDHEAAVPEFQLLAALAKEQFERGAFVQRSIHDGVHGWHLPYVTDAEREEVSHLVRYGSSSDPFDPVEIPVFGKAGNTSLIPPRYGMELPGMRALLTMCVARCCRLSYGDFDGGASTFEKDYATFKKLATDPLHASPMEHAAFPLSGKMHSPSITGNFHGFAQLRKMMPNEAVEEAIMA